MGRISNFPYEHFQQKCEAVLRRRMRNSSLSSGVTVGGGVAPGHEVLQLPFDISKHRRCADPEQIGLQPAIAEFFLHQCEPGERVLRS